MAKKEKSIPQKKTSKKKSFSTILFVFLAALSLVFKGMSILLLIGLLPTIVMYFVERGRTPYLTFCIGSMNVMGMIPIICVLIQKGGSFSDALSLMVTPKTWLIMYGGAAIGLSIYAMTPSFVRFFRLIFLKKQLTIAEAEQNKLIETWGDKITKEKN